MGSYCPSEDDIRSVIAFFPDVDPEAVRKDLQYVTQNVEATVHRILDGNLKTDYSNISESRKVRQSPDTEEEIQPTFSISDSDDDLPYIPASKKKKEAVPSSSGRVTVLDSLSTNGGSSKYYSGECFPSTPTSISKAVPETVSLSSDSEEESLPSLGLKTDKDFEIVPSLSERLKQYKTSGNTSFISSDSKPLKHVGAAKLKSSGLRAESDSESDDLPDLPETSQLPLSDHQTLFSYSSPSYDSASATLSQSSSSLQANSQLSSTASTYRDSEEMVSSVTTMDSQEMVSSVTTMDSQEMVSSVTTMDSEEMVSSVTTMDSQEMVSSVTTMDSEEMVSSVTTMDSQEMVSSVTTMDSEEMVSSVTTMDSEEMVSSVTTMDSEEMVSSVTTMDSQEMVSSVTTMDSQYSDDDHSRGKKKKRTPAEIAEQKRLAQQKKQQRERELLLKKKQKELEKAEKKAALEARKCMKPGECLKYVAVKFDSNVVQSTVGPVLLKLLQEAGIQYEVGDQPIPACISWTRKVVDHQVQGLTLQQLTKDVDEQHCILIVPVQDFVSMVHGTVNVGSTDHMSLPEFAWQASASLGDKKLSLIVQGMEKYFRDLKTIGQRQYKEAVRSTDPAYNANKKQKGIYISIVISRFDMEQAMLELQLSAAGCGVSLVETPEEVAKIIFRHTKSVAEAPFKKEKNQGGFSFLPDSTSCVKIEKNGGGLLKCWKQQLCQFNNLTPEVANAIVAEYPSPGLLIQAYEQCQSQREAERLLEDVRVRRGAGVLETSRRVGKEMSRRIYELFTGTDPDSVIN